MEIKSSPLIARRISFARGRGRREGRFSPLWVDEEWEGGEKGAREGFMPRLTLLLTVAYYGNFLKLWVGENVENNANRKRIIIGL